MNTDYLSAFFYGVLFGIPFCLAVGPVFFLLIQAGVNRGIHFALAIALGVILGDIVLIFATYYFVESIQAFVLSHTMAIQLVVSILLLIMGLVSIFKKAKIAEKTGVLKYRDSLLFVFNGFVLDVLNPSNVMVWTAVNSSIITYNGMQHIIFYSASLITIGGLMLTLAYSSVKIEPFIKKSLIRKFNIISGLIYIGFSIFMIFGGDLLKKLF